MLTIDRKDSAGYKAFIWGALGHGWWKIPTNGLLLSYDREGKGSNQNGRSKTCPWVHPKYWMTVGLLDG